MRKKPWATKPPGKKYYVIRWVDQATGSTRQKSTGHTRRRQAEREADEFAATLAAGIDPEDVSWSAFKRRYEAEGMTHCRPSSVKKWRTSARLIAREIDPLTIGDVNQNSLSKMCGRLLEGGMKKSTLDSHMAHVLAALSWACSMQMIPAVPILPKKKGARQRKMKGRAITGEEFDRMLKQCPNPTWELLLRGLWLSGMRLQEALNLSWDDSSAILVVGVDTARPMLEIPGGLEKGDRDRLHPITPDFAELLRQVPPRERNQWVFNPELSRGPTRNMQSVSAKISSIGKKAGVVAVVPGPSRKAKFASAHDLRRSFGTRWAPRVMPVVLQRLMRHADIATTMKYYVDLDARQLADTIWEAGGASQRDPQRDPSENQEDPSGSKH